MNGFACRKLLYGVGFSLLASNAYSHGGDSSLIHACVDAQNILIFSGPDLDCNAGETPVHWSIQGPPGPTDPLLLGRIGTLETQVATLQAQVAGLIAPALPDVFVSDVTLDEGSTFSTLFQFTISLSMPSSDTVVVNYGTADGTTDGFDYSSRAGQLIFLPGETSKIVNVPVVGDTDLEFDETFFLNVNSAVNANGVGVFGTGFIVTDDMPHISISGQAIGVEGDLYVYDVTLSRTAPFDVSVDYTVVDGTATVADNDIIDTSGTLVFSPGQTTAQITVQTNADENTEVAEDFSVRIENPVNAALSTAQVTSTLLDISGVGNLSILGASIIEGDNAAAFKTMQMNIVMSPTSSSEVRVRYGQAIGGTATTHTFFNPGGDVRVTPFSACNADTAPSTCPTLIFSPGETQKTINIQVKGDTVVEGNENFFVKIFEPIGGVITDDIAEGIIIDDD